MFLFGMMVSSAFAKSNGNFENKTNEKSSQDINAKFNDIDEAQWASKHVMKMKAENIINGYEDGSFKPNKPVTRAEAVVLTLKAAGLQNEIDSVVVDSTVLTFKDAKNIPAWAQKAVALAVKKGFLENDPKVNFQPNKAASREWVVKLVAKSLGLQPVNINLPFSDADKISADTVGYVAAVVYKQLVSGFPDGSFQPNKPVTRAEFAVMLGLTTEEMPIPGKIKSKVVGTVVAISTQGSVTSGVYAQVYQGSITLNTENDEDDNAQNITVTYPVAKDVLIYIDDKAAALKDIIIGSKVKMVLNQQGLAVYLEVAPIQIKGVVEAVYSDKLTINQNGLEEDAQLPNITTSTTYTVANDIAITLNGKTAALTALMPKDVVKLTLNSEQKVISIKASRFNEDSDELKDDEKDEHDKDKYQHDKKNKHHDNDEIEQHDDAENNQ